MKSVFSSQYRVISGKAFFLPNRICRRAIIKRLFFLLKNQTHGLKRAPFRTFCSARSEYKFLFPPDRRFLGGSLPGSLNTPALRRVYTGSSNHRYPKRHLVADDNRLFIFCRYWKSRLEKFFSLFYMRIIRSRIFSFHPTNVLPRREDLN